MLSFFNYIETVEEIMDYILDMEEDDFFENSPSEDHVYYKAALVKHGKETADMLLKSALEKF